MEPESKSTGTSTQRSIFRWPLVVALFLLATYGWYVYVQYDRINNLHQHELAGTAAELKRTFDNSVENVNHFYDRQSKASNEDRKEHLCEFDAEQLYLSAVPTCQETGGDKKETAAPGIAGNGPLIKPDPVATGEEGGSFHFDAPELLRDLAFPEAFQIIFLADADGKVFYSDTPAQRSWQRNLRWGERQFRDAGADSGASVRLQDLQQALDTKEAWQKLSAISSRTSISIGGSEYQLHIEPAKLGQGTGKSVNLVLGGLVLSDQVREQALAVDTYFVAVLVALLLLGALGFPFIKLIALHPHERFRSRDIHWLCMSTGAILALLTFTVLAADAYWRWHEDSSDGLEQYARDLDKKFKQEVDELQKQLRDYDQRLAALPPGSCKGWPLDSDWFNPDVTEKHKFEWPSDKVYLEQIAWISPAGMQIWKITADRDAGLVDVSKRAYFRAVRDQNLYRIPGSQDRFYLAPDRSITDGRFYTFISMPSTLATDYCSNLKPPVDGEKGYVAAATATLLSFEQNPLPANYGFAVITREGRVLYHSDSRLRLRESFFEETSRGPRIRSSVYGGHADDISSGYRERPHEIYVCPLSIERVGESVSNNSPLFLAVFRDLSVERASVAHVFITTMTGSLLFLLPWLAFALWVMKKADQKRKRHPGTWLWPDVLMTDFYRHMIKVLAVIILLTPLAFLVLGAWLAVLVPLVAASWRMYTYWGYIPKTPHHKSKYRPWHLYVTELTLVLICMIVIPCAIIHRVTQNAEFGHMVAAGVQAIGEQQQDIEPSMKASIRQEGRPQSAALAKSTTRVKKYLPPAPFPYNTLPQQAGMSSMWLLQLHSLLGGFIPVANELVSLQFFEHRDRIYSTTSPVSWVGILGGIGILILIVWWIRWVAHELFYAELAVPTGIAPQLPTSEDWDALSADGQLVLFWALEEHVVNPRQRATVEALIDRGLLTLAPDLQLGSAHLKKYVQDKAANMSAQIADLEQAASNYSWQRVQRVLWAGLAAVAIFLLATQPLLQSGLQILALAVTRFLKTFKDLFDALVDRLGGKSK